MGRQLLHIVSASVLFSGLAFSQSTAFAQSCGCEEIVCSPCEDNVGTDFYTESCEGGKIKSCQRPRCELKKDLPKGCAHLAPQAVSQNVVESSSPEALIAEKDKKSVGAFLIVRGDVKVVSNGKEANAKVGDTIFEKDVVVTDAFSHAKIMFLDKNTINVTPNSRLKVRGFEEAGVTANSTTTLDLIYGKVRSQVVTKSRRAGKPSFLIRTPSAIAGVRGTDFVVTHLKGGDITKVETLKGSVELGDHKHREKSLVKKGQYASYVLLASNSARDDGVINDDDIGSWNQRGFLTPVYKLSDKHIELIDIATDYREDDTDRGVANLAKVTSEDKNICVEPGGAFNQCAWVCVNNPSGETKCRTDLSNVRCVRKKCDANGRWAAEERLPASTGSIKCDARSPVVGPCDY